MLLWFEKYYDVNLTLYNWGNFLKTDLEKALCPAWGIAVGLYKGFELRANFLKHSQNSQFN